MGPESTAGGTVLCAILQTALPALGDPLRSDVDPSHVGERVRRPQAHRPHDRVVRIARSESRREIRQGRLGHLLQRDETGPVRGELPRRSARIGVHVADVVLDDREVVGGGPGRGEQQAAEDTGPHHHRQQRGARGGGRAPQQRRYQQDGAGRREPGEERLEEAAEASGRVGHRRVEHQQACEEHRDHHRHRVPVRHRARGRSRPSSPAEPRGCPAAQPGGPGPHPPGLRPDPVGLCPHPVVPAPHHLLPAFRRPPSPAHPTGRGHDRRRVRIPLRFPPGGPDRACDSAAVGRCQPVLRRCG